MTREEAIDILFGVIQANSEEENEALDMAIKSLEQTRWIPCSERLPEVAQRVLLSSDNGYVMIGILHGFGKYTFEPTGLGYVYPMESIRAWMPLPEPWKGGEEE